MPGPATFTGEDAGELLLAGNPHVIQRVLDACLAQAGVRLAQPGEFTARAFLAGKISLDRAEGVAAIIAAQTSEQLEAATSLHNGTTGAAYRAWADELTGLVALVEAGIDFTDQEDVVAIRPAALAERLRRVRDGILVRIGAEGGASQTHAQVVATLVGEPNAGKSTLFNALLGRERAIASPRAGTTRDVLEEPLRVGELGAGGVTIRLQDVAGFAASDAGHASPSDRAAVEAARAAAGRADVLIWCDPSGRFDEARLHAWIALDASGEGETSARRRVLRVRTFADRATDGAMHGFGSRSGASAMHEPLRVCGLDGWHVGALARALGEIALAAPSRGAALAALAPRHHAALRRALGAIVLVLEMPGLGDGNMPALAQPEVVVEHLREALAALGELTGSSITPDDVLGRVFATFCVGK
jgi:tRNA modification GTPase